jgi:glutaredoxin-related protein
MNKSLFTKDELQDLRKEFIEFKINEMTMEDMASYIHDIMIHDVNVLNEEELRYEIDSYDEYLYEILAKYVKDEEGSYEEMQEFIHDRQANDWIDN